jgi:hypothetical protein
MEGTRPTSRHGHVRAQNGRLSPFEGSTVLFQGCGAPTVQEWVAQCRGADTGLTAQYRTVAGMASPGGLVEQRRGMVPRHARGATWIHLQPWAHANVSALNPPVEGAGMEAAGP